ncbi:MAG: transposase [Nanoarchaeota archaeon]|nr:transposase [Nanoarchaeota archaeon]
MRQLIRYKKNKIFVILDNLKVHHSKIFKEWLETKKDRIETFYLPSYSPDLNPDERLNCDLKTNFFYSYSSPKKEKFKKEITSFMKSLQKDSKRGRSYFKKDTVRYAA